MIKSIKYLIIAAVLFFVEVLIALFVHDGFVRPFFGDFLVVILIYCSIKAFWNVSIWKAALGVLLFAYLVEALQYFKILKMLHLQHSKIANIIVGTSFAWEDILCYTAGIIFVILLEGKRTTNETKAVAKSAEQG